MARSDVWANAEAYEGYVGRWSRRVAREFIGSLGVLAGKVWLDIGCGTGALTETILQNAQPERVEGVDPSAGFVEYSRERVQDERASFRVGDAVLLPFSDAAFDAVVSGLVLNHISAHGAALTEMARVARQGATVAAYVWDYAGKMQMLRIFWDAAVELDPSAVDLHQGNRYPICKPEPLAALFSDAGLSDVQVGPLDITTTFRDFDDYWLPFLAGQGPAPAYAASLDDASIAALKERVRAALPFAPDGTIPLVARAWAVRGTR
jgi:SAM-dependent methyltransferase